MNGLANLEQALLIESGNESGSGAHEVQVDPEIGRQALRSIDRMLEFAAQNGIGKPTGDLAKDAATYHRGMGPA